MKKFYSLKNLLVIFSLSALCVSCTKKETSAPMQAGTNQSSSVSYKDDNISISNFQASEVSSSDLKVSFSVLYASGVSKVDVLSGGSENQLCSFYSVNVNNINSKSDFSVEDNHLKGTTMYYMIKFTLANGNWGYTPVYSLQIK